MRKLIFLSNLKYSGYCNDHVEKLSKPVVFFGREISNRPGDHYNLLGKTSLENRHKKYLDIELTFLVHLVTSIIS